ncbi:MraY family glycosyltransferase [Aurantibacter aestuarii]|uniref:Undecaprenyl/decaprenyl-phosphate alpha-N-acetylglucosaminyl 1-phosphate transferase n=1 Tax=Aurantibacter aestuarii TaxID=1266046 RepID=A0A2T1NCW7_9FLAO|nr:MraY family glycosyltransferase [Aurantibacter aestuarii]PSG90257.1 undecaprenyl/decaprenyl-phosphate alpha-N-acetylglucosaminyl 1-phosphate transferase [Aurantibacter aestuarii]
MEAILIFAGAFLLTYFTIPKIIALVKYKDLLDAPNVRSSHLKHTPTLGGIAFYFTLMFSLFFLKDYDVTKVVYNIIPGLTILFIFGLKDDLVILSPIAKLFAQIVAVSFILINDSFLINSLNGFLTLQEIPNWIAFFISGFLMILVINAYNLIDGIDGLAAGIGIVISSVYLVIFYFLKMEFYVYLSLILIAILLAFLRYNLSRYNKIFMGDTGSLIVGFILGVFTIKLLSLKNYIESSDFPLLIENIPLVALAILVVPLFDTTRVFAIRLLNKKSPFSADRNHLHHILIKMGFSHLKASIVLTISNLLFVVLFIYLASTSKQYFLIAFGVVFIFIIIFIFYKLNSKFTENTSVDPNDDLNEKSS